MTIRPVYADGPLAGQDFAVPGCGLAGTVSDQLSLGTAVIDLVGPKGYVHGWVFVGVPAVGDTVTHPRLGRGTVTGHTGTHVSVRFDEHGDRVFEHADRADGQEPRFVSRDEHEGAFGRSAATILGTQLESDGSLKAAAYRSSLHHVPEPFLRELKKFGTRVVLTQDPVGVKEKDLAGIRPRGYPEGMTWRDSSGAYRPLLKRAVVGNTVGSGSTDVALHETSHAIDDALRYPSRQPGFVSVYHDAVSALGADLSPYYGAGQDTEQAARSEFFAESMAAWMKNEADSPQARVDAMISAVAPGASAAAERGRAEAAARFLAPAAARQRLLTAAQRSDQARAAMAQVAAFYEALLSETKRKQGQ